MIILRHDSDRYPTLFAVSRSAFWTAAGSQLGVALCVSGVFGAQFEQATILITGGERLPDGTLAQNVAEFTKVFPPYLGLEAPTRLLLGAIIQRSA